jgi:hypothetical protein
MGLEVHRKEIQLAELSVAQIRLTHSMLKEKQTKKLARNVNDTERKTRHGLHEAKTHKARGNRLPKDFIS